MEDITIRGRVQKRVEICIYIRGFAQPQNYRMAGEENTEASREQGVVIEEGWTR